MHQTDFNDLSTIKSTFLNHRPVSSNWLAIIAIATVMVMFMLITAIPSATKSISTLFIIFIVALTFSAFGLFMYLASKAEKRKIEILRAFAAKNTFTYQQENKNFDEPGALFGLGSSRRQKHLVGGTLQGFPFKSYEYYFETSAGKSRTTHDAMVFEITLPRVVPQFVIDSEIVGVMPIQFDKSQLIELEGDFSKYFDLYAPDKYSVSALTILAPDTMEVVMEHAALCDIEVVKNKLYFYWATPAASKEQYEKLYGTAEAVLKKVGKKLSTADIYATKEQAALHSSASTEGVRLKKSKAGLILAATLFIFYALQITNVANFGTIGGFGIMLFWIGFIIIGFWYFMRNYRLQKSYLDKYSKDYNRKDQ